MKKQDRNSTCKTIEIEYSEQDVQEMREQDVSEDELPRVGVHTFRQSRFITDRRDQKIKISINLDADILDFFKDLATQPDAASYQTQINNELRGAMERKQQTEDEIVTLKMLENPKFLSRLAEKLKNAA